MELALASQDSIAYALMLAKVPSCVARKRTFQLLSRIVCKGVSKYGWSVEAVETARQVVTLLLSRTSPFDLSPADFKKQGCNDAIWWRLVNQHKEWSPRAHLLYPVEFRQRVECALLCFKYLAPQLRYPLPKPIQYDIIRCVVFVDVCMCVLFVCVH